MEISDKQLRLNQSLHDQSDLFGGRTTAAGMAQRLPLAIHRMHEMGYCSSLLDYGTGKGLLVERLRHELSPSISVNGYDPAVQQWSTKPTIASDIVTCFDVLEHVEIENIDYIIRDIFALTRHFCYISIDLQPATKCLDDGRNSHILLAPPDWWISRFSQVFSSIVSFPVMHLAGVCQKCIIAATKDAKYLPQMYIFLNKINVYGTVLRGGNIVD